MNQQLSPVPWVVTTILVLGAFAALPLAVAPAPAQTIGTPQVAYSGNAVNEYYFDPTGFFCAFGVTMESLGAVGGDDYRIEVGILLDLNSEPPDDVFLLDFTFQPLVINGVPVVMEPHPCWKNGSLGRCKVEDASPSPETHRWIQYRSNALIPATPGASTLDFVVEAYWPYSTTNSVRTTDSGVWVSDDRDDRYGYVVTDYDEFGPFPYMIPECMGKDKPDANVLYVNGNQGPFLDITPGAPLDLSIVLPPAGGNGKYLVHLNAGVPDPFTVTNVGAGLGDACFPMLLPPAGDAVPVCVWNNIGKESKFGSTSYFGADRDPPPRAPAFFETQPSGDPANLPAGSEWTIQGIIVNPTSSSPKGASVTNVIELHIQ